MDSCFSEGNYREVKRKQIRPGLELMLSIPFLSMINRYNE